MVKYASIVASFVILVAFFSVGLSNNAFAMNYTKTDPAVKFSCFQKDNGTLIVDKDGMVMPCPIDSGDNAWMLTSSALVTNDDSWRLSNIL